MLPTKWHLFSLLSLTLFPQLATFGSASQLETPFMLQLQIANVVCSAATNALKLSVCTQSVQFYLPQVML